MNRVFVAAVALFLLLTSQQAFAFRCGSRLVSEGDTRATVVAKCGEPTEVDRRSTWRRPMVFMHGRPVYIASDLMEIPVELWIYNLGPNKLMRRVKFEDGLVVEIETLGYGYYEAPAATHHGR
jgi:hypothetical protein